MLNNEGEAAVRSIVSQCFQKGTLPSCAATGASDDQCSSQERRFGNSFAVLRRFADKSRALRSSRRCSSQTRRSYWAGLLESSTDPRNSRQRLAPAAQADLPSPALFPRLEIQAFRAAAGRDPFRKRRRHEDVRPGRQRLRSARHRGRYSLEVGNMLDEMPRA